MYKHPSTIESVSIDGEIFPVTELENDIQIHHLDENGHCTFTFRNKKHEVIIDLLNKEDREYTFKVKGKEFNLKINTRLSLLIDQLGFNSAAENRDAEILAPMPGLVLKTLVHPGDEVQEGQILLTLEAMKMENVIKSPRSGTIKSVLVADGDKVDKGNTLVEF